MVDVMPPDAQNGIETYLPSFESAESIREYYGLRKDIRLNTKEGEDLLLEKMEEKHPDLNGHLHEAHEYVRRIYDQYLINEQLHENVREEVSEAQMDKHKSFIRRHPFLTAAAGIAALIALLYFTGTLAPTVGEYGTGLIESFKGVLGKIGLATPGVAVDATAAVPVTGDIIGAEAAEAATQSFMSPGEAMIQNAQAAEVLDAATGATGVNAGELSQAASEVLQSPQAAEALQKAAQQTDITDPLQRIFRDLPPQ